MNRVVTTFLILFILIATTGCSNNETLENYADKHFGYLNGQNNPSVSILVIKAGQVLLKKSYGHSNVETKELATPQSNYRLASVTKMFTATVIMRLAEEGKLSLDQPIIELMADFPEYGKTVTVRNLLNHTSGLRDYYIYWPEEKGTMHDSDVYEVMKTAEGLSFVPGTKYVYCDTNYVILGILASKLYNQPFPQVMNEKIFQPIQMTSSILFQDGVNAVPNRVYGAQEVDGKYTTQDQYAYSQTMGDGGIYTSLEDLIQWDKAIDENLIVGMTMQAQAFSVPKTCRSNYGFGWEIGKVHGMTRYCHSGGTIGFSTGYIKVPEKRITVIVLSNNGAMNTTKVAEKVLDKVLSEERKN